jgi:zinc transport system ATP-binding protein
VLRGIDLALGEGEVVALLGSNGSGKSTLVRAALGLVPLARGTVELFGTPLARFSSWDRVGYVPQRLAAGGGVPATVWEVVASGRLARRGLLRPLSRADRTAITDALDAVELGDRRHESASALSGGQQQRVLIARALAGRPDLLVLDEPTAGVDLHSQQAFADVLGSVAASGATVLLVAHELGALEALIHRTVVLRDGRIAYDGAPRAGDGLHAFHDHARPEGPSGPTVLDSRWPM